MIAPVHISPAVLAVPQQGAADLRHGHPDLVGPAGEQTALHQRELSPGLQSPVQRGGALAAGDGAAVEGHLLFGLVFQEKALDPPLRQLGPAHGDTEIGFLHLMGFNLLVDDPQRLGVFGGDDDAAGIAVDPVAQGGGEGVFPFGIPLPLLIEVGLDVVDEGVDLLSLVGMDHQAGAFVRQQQVLVLIDDVQPGLEQGEEHVFLRGLVKELIIDV